MLKDNLKGNFIYENSENPAFQGLFWVGGISEEEQLKADIGNGGVDHEI